MREDMRTHHRRAAVGPFGVGMALMDTLPVLGGYGHRSQTVHSMGMEVLTEGGDLVFRVYVPGVAADDADVSVEDGVMTVRATRRVSREDSGEDYWYSEIRRGDMVRSIRLPEGVGTSGMTADLSDGILTVRVALPEDTDAGSEAIHVPVGGKGSGPAEKPAGKKPEVAEKPGK